MLFIKTLDAEKTQIQHDGINSQTLLGTGANCQNSYTNIKPNKFCFICQFICFQISSPHKKYCHIRNMSFNYDVEGTTLAWQYQTNQGIPAELQYSHITPLCCFVTLLTILKKSASAIWLMHLAILAF